MHKGLFTIVQN